MMNRRKFLELSSMAIVPVVASPLSAWASDARFPIGLQLSTLVKQKTAETDLVSALHQIREIGFQEVEPWHAAYSIPAAQFKKDIVESGLKVSSGHFEYADLTADLSGQLRYARELGLTWVVCPMLPKPQWESAEGFRTAARQFNEWAKHVREAGMRFAFHNHDYEFRTFAGSTGFDILLNETDPSLVFYEMNCYWITQAGLDPVAMLHRLGRRVRMLHVKDRKPGFPASNDMSASSAHFTEIGSGAIDWVAILAVAKQLDIEHYFIEQDHIDGPPVQSLRTSYNYLRKILA